MIQKNFYAINRRHSTLRSDDLYVVMSRVHFSLKILLKDSTSPMDFIQTKSHFDLKVGLLSEPENRDNILRRLRLIYFFFFILFFVFVRFRRRHDPSSVDGSNE